MKLALLKIKAHEARALATSFAYFDKFYLRDVSKQSNNLHLLGSVVAAQKVVGEPFACLYHPSHLLLVVITTALA